MNKSLKWYLRRHPLLYRIRFRLVSKKVTATAVENFCYNDINKKETISSLFFEKNAVLFGNKSPVLSDFEKAKEIAVWLKKNTKGGPGLGKSSATALTKMINGDGGVCSDFTQVYNNFCVINDLKVKEWGMKISSDDSSISGGHSFNEVYCNEFKKWIMIDVAKSICFYHNNKNIPLSTLEFIQLKKEQQKISFQNINPAHTIEDLSVHKIFLDSNSLLFVITNYNNKTYDYFLDKLAFFPESIIHGLLLLLGKSYAFEFPKE